MAVSRCERWRVRSQPGSWVVGGGGGPAAPHPHNNSNLPAAFIKGPRGPALTLIRVTTAANRVISSNVLFCLGRDVSKAWGWRSGPWTAQ